MLRQSRQHAAQGDGCIAHLVDTDTQGIGSSRILADRFDFQAPGGFIEDKPGNGHQQVGPVYQQVLVEEDLSDDRNV